MESPNRDLWLRHSVSGRHMLPIVGEAMTTAVARILDDLRSRGGLQGKDIANIVDVSTATVSRWSRGNGSPDIRTQTVIADLRYVVDRLSDFYTADETRLWLHSRHPLLNNERAIDLINADRTEEVLAVIERLDAGAFI
jgi:transcriptional regulator with XRE-family HTH domain